jgi:hypothetical protein
MRTGLLLIATVGVIAVGYAATTEAASNPWTTEQYFTQETWHSFADIGKKDNGGPNDIYVAQQSLNTAAGRRVGSVNGYGVNLHPPYVFFHWTATLSGGTLTIASAIDLKASPSVYPIDGGTGRYAGVRGTVTLTDGRSRGIRVTIRYEPAQR